MTTLKKTIFLNTLGDNAADFRVDSAGFLRITSLTAPFSVPRMIKSQITRTNAVAEVLGVAVRTINSSVVVGKTYKINIEGNSAFGGGTINPTTQTYSYTAITGDTATTIAVALKDAINANQIKSKCVATNTAGALTITAMTGYPCITVNTFSDPLIAITSNTVGVNAVGTYASIISNPNYINKDTFGTPTVGATYTLLNVSFEADNNVTMPSSTSTEQSVYSVFINNAATSSGANSAAVNLAAIINTSYGTATLAQSGYRAILSTATPTISIASNVATLAGTGNSVITAGIMPNDWVVADPIIGGTASAGQVLALGTGTTAGTWDATRFYVSAGSASAKTFTLVQVRNLPR
jgi:hypothetical protein